MITTKEFKTAHNLSDSSFKRLRETVQTRYPDRPLVKRLNGQDWEILELELFLEVLGEKKPKPDTETSALALQTEVIETGIQIPTDDDFSMLDGLIAEFVPAKPEPFAPIHLNGSQAELMQSVQELAQKAQRLKLENEQKLAALQTRKAMNQKLELAVRALQDNIQDQTEIDQAIQEEAKQVLAQESALKKLLGNG
jgi:hypothetical protein